MLYVPENFPLKLYGENMKKLIALTLVVVCLTCFSFVGCGESKKPTTPAAPAGGDAPADVPAPADAPASVPAPANGLVLDTE